MVSKLMSESGLLKDPRVVEPAAADSSYVVSQNPATSSGIAAVKLQSTAEYNEIVERAIEAQLHWRRATHIHTIVAGGADSHRQRICPVIPGQTPLAKHACVPSPVLTQFVVWDVQLQGQGVLFPEQGHRRLLGMRDTERKQSDQAINGAQGQQGLVSALVP